MYAAAHALADAPRSFIEVALNIHDVESNTCVNMSLEAHEVSILIPFLWEISACLFPHEQNVWMPHSIRTSEVSSFGIWVTYDASLVITLSS